MTNHPIRFFLSQAHPCDYLPGETTVNVFADPAFPMSTGLYSRLITHGFRRSGDLVYRPHCTGCSACVPVRIAVADFAPNRSQRRIWQLNTDICARPAPALFDAEHYALYKRYLLARHRHGSMADSTAEDYIRFLASTWCSTSFVEFRTGEKLAAVAVCDRLHDGLSAVYTFFDPSLARRSLGTYAVLWLVEEAKRTKLPYVYLGYWIKNCRKMAYKTRFRPIEAFYDGEWRRYKKGEALAD